MPKGSRGEKRCADAIGLAALVGKIATGEVEDERKEVKNRRFTRLANAFSKKLDNHIDALAVYFAFYNFYRLHKSLRVTPAMAAGITDRLWSLEDVIARIDADAPAPKSRGSYKKRKKAA